LGGVRTALFTYLFARQHEGKFILRIEDTDQNRFVAGAEEYIVDCLEWCGISPDESAQKGGDYGPYRQSERKVSYRQYAEQLVADSYAYYAFDTQEELEAKRMEVPNFTYGLATRMDMRNSLTLKPSEVNALLSAGVPHVVRVKIPEGEVVSFTDMIRGHVSFETNLIDDKVLLKADGMPTYHLAVVVDDKAMEISHVFRGEEWLPSAPIHLLLWKYLGWEADMPAWVHLPLILKPDGNGKLSKRDGDRLGFPVYAQNWKDPKTGELTKGFKELGFLPEAFVNLLAMLGWNDGTDQELFSMDELIGKFSVDRISKAGAKFDYEKAKWYNHEWIKNADASLLLPQVKTILESQGLQLDRKGQPYLERVLQLTKDRCTLLSDFTLQAGYFFSMPVAYDVPAVKGKWSEAKENYFKAYATQLTDGLSSLQMETLFKQLAEESGLKPGELMLPFRIMLVGGKFGPAVFDIAELLGSTETIKRIESALNAFRE
jgi:glutamyl-tRNA synthetase